MTYEEWISSGKACSRAEFYGESFGEGYQIKAYMSGLPICYNCRKIMQERERQDGVIFYGCTSYPKCTYTMRKDTNKAYDPYQDELNWGTA